MKHAYLIMAHNEFEQLQRLINALDDKRNDIYVHIDRKVKHVPVLSTKFSRLFFTKKRINVIWGSVRQIEAEYLLFESAYNSGSYDYYHVISGLHYPLKSLDEIDQFFLNCNGNSVLIPMHCGPDEIITKCGYRYYFLRYLISSNKFLNRLYHILWRAAVYPQKKFGIRRDTSFLKRKAANWCSVTEDAVCRILSQKKYIFNKFKRTFCGDEFFMEPILEGMPVVHDEKLLFVEFDPMTPIVLEKSDFNKIITSDCIFGRKFTSKSSELIKLIDENKCVKKYQHIS